MPLIVLFVLCEIQNINLNPVQGWLSLYCVFIAFLSLLMIKSVCSEYNIATSLRFYFILVFIPIATQIRDNEFEIKWKIFKLLTVAFCILIFVIWLNLMTSGDFVQYRKWAIENGVGDIYIVNGRAKVQLRGCSLFVIAFVIDIFHEKRITLYNCCMIIGAIIAGNDAYLLGIAATIVYILSKKMIDLLKKKSFLSIVISFILIVVLIVGGIYAIKIWIDKSAYSNAVRLSQMELLLDTNWIYGSGFGHPILGQASTVTYNGSETYFEVQTLYIFNQVGIIGLALFYILTFAPLSNGKDYRMIVAYLIYIIYSFWNPYCFDSNHIVALLLITNVLRTVSDPLNKATKKSLFINSNMKIYEKNICNNNTI